MYSLESVKMKDLVIGAAYNLNWDRCKYWVNSLKRTGYNGDIVLCIFGQNDELAAKCEENGVEVVKLRSLHPHEHICAARFFVYYAVLADKKRNYRWVISTDVTDVVFQKNPSRFLDAYVQNTIIASSENIKYKDEPWGANNIKQVFGDITASTLMDRGIVNAGVMAGSHEIMRDLFFLIHTMSEKTQQHVPGDGGPDQAIYNYLLSLEPYKSHTTVVSHDTGWACQVGTTADPNKPHYNDKQLDPRPLLIDNRVCTSNLINDFYIVHQYNRNPQWRHVIEENYK